MKKVLALLTILFFAGATHVIAQPPGGGQMDPAQRLAMMKERYKSLGLNDVQVDSVIAITNDFRPKQMEVFRDQNLSQDDKMSKMKELATARDKRLDAALPKDLAQKVKDALAQQAQRMMQGGGRQGGNN